MNLCRYLQIFDTTLVVQYQPCEWVDKLSCSHVTFWST